ncbi:hypothetical protein GCK72_018203 [Caenorhabditis remanei]|uniref:Uncharacterized protein n=1 Tax=Caenorhabditis remanei TaxID=31234 RepID=A0A6A5GB57_CAERE|nr:hypothetical protein GCK72_018203 [Caenorhabditis remanei]KAF1751649.1 hypothetical protein GCK72_018203 [Caenorhabditis remanei]
MIIKFSGITALGPVGQHGQPVRIPVEVVEIKLELVHVQTKRRVVSVLETQHQLNLVMPMYVSFHGKVVVLESRLHWMDSSSAHWVH